MRVSRFLEVIFLYTLVGLLISSCGTVRSTESVRTGEADDGSMTMIGAGVASWYGPKFHGRPTANGERYDMDGFTAAHKTLPFNTVVRVVNQDNGNVVDVRINDRGPYVGNRIIDLSRRAAREIKMIQPGTSNVLLYLLDEGDRPVTLSNSSSRETFTVQLASYHERQRAQQESRKIKGSRVEETRVSGKTVYRVYYGTFHKVEEAEKELTVLQRDGFSGFVKQVEN
ncbi:MAG: septal ring lytic transglycosylase RlpA family protein [Balneolaceae bacterium]